MLSDCLRSSEYIIDTFISVCVYACACMCVHVCVFSKLNLSPGFSSLGSREHALGTLYKILRPHHQGFCLNWFGLGPGECVYLTLSLDDSNVQPWFRGTAVSFLIHRKMV